MRGYQEKGVGVKGTIAILDEEPLVRCAAEGLKALCIQVGMEVMAQLLEGEVEAVCGPKGQHNAERGAYRHGKEKSRVVLGGEKVSIEKPRARSKDGHELPLGVLELFQNEDPLNEEIVERLLCGVSTRKYERTMKPSGIEGGSTSKSEVSRRFIAGMERMMTEFFSRQIDDDYPAIEMDGTMLGKMTVIVALGISRDGKKRILGLIEGGTENHTVANALLSDMISRGLTADVPRIFVLDGGKGLHKAVKDTFGGKVKIQRCQVHKKRNVLSHLPESEQATVGFRLNRAYLEHDFDKAKAALERIADDLQAHYPSAAASLREGLEETLTVHTLGLPGLLRQTLSSTNAIESANSVCMGVLRRVSRFRDGQMILRHAAAGFLEAERGFRRIYGYRELPFLTAALARVCLPESSLPHSFIA
jgi:transposase-like protein